jgi:hypothetical protein
MEAEENDSFRRQTAARRTRPGLGRSCSVVRGGVVLNHRCGPLRDRRAVNRSPVARSRTGGIRFSVRRPIPRSTVARKVLGSGFRDAYAHCAPCSTSAWSPWGTGRRNCRVVRPSRIRRLRACSSDVQRRLSQGFGGRPQNFGFASEGRRQNFAVNFAESHCRL